MRNYWPIIGAVWSFVRMVLLFFALVSLGSFQTPKDHLLLLVFASGGIGLITMYLQLIVQPLSQVYLKRPLLVSSATLFILGSICLFLIMNANLGESGLLFGAGNASVVTLLVLIAVLGDSLMFGAVKHSKEQEMES